MRISKEAPPKVFVPVTFTFDNESELHDVVAALAAYANKSAKVSGTGIKEQYGLNAYFGNARRTVNDLLPEIVEALELTTAGYEAEVDELEEVEAF